MKEDDKKCFVIMPISDPIGYEKGHFANIYNNLIKPAVENAGYQSERADEARSSSFIIKDIVERIYAAPIAICDISSHNPNVFYELGLRHASGLPVVLIKDKKTENPFDISGIRYAEYSQENDYATVLRNQTIITKAIEDTICKHKEGEYSCSIMALRASVLDDKNGVQLSKNLVPIEKEMEKISKLIDETYLDSIGDHSVASLIIQFGKMCRRYDKGISFYEYLKKKYLCKFPNDSYRFLVPIV